MDLQAIAMEIARNAPATFVLGFVAWKLDGRIATLTDRVDAAFTRLIDAALSKQ